MIWKHPMFACVSPSPDKTKSLRSLLIKYMQKLLYVANIPFR